MKPRSQWFSSLVAKYALQDLSPDTGDFSDNADEKIVTKLRGLEVKAKGGGGGGVLVIHSQIFYLTKLENSKEITICTDVYFALR